MIDETKIELWLKLAGVPSGDRYSDEAMEEHP
jgi:hypothetical protein